MNSNKETASQAESNLRKKSRIAAFWYLLVLVTEPFILWLIIRGARLKPLRKAAPAGA